jgi:hypothetical protein
VPRTLRELPEILVPVPHGRSLACRVADIHPRDRDDRLGVVSGPWMSTDDWLAAGLVLVLIPGVFLTVYELVMSWDPTTRWRTEDRQPGESSWTWRTVVLIAFWSLVVPAVLTAWVLFLVN